LGSLLAAEYQSPLSLSLAVPVSAAPSRLAAETRARKSVCLLGPTINVPRSPLCGRTFEQFSEDPTLSGQLAAAYINGLQAGGISPTVKHFVGNEQEHERNGVDSIIEPRAFREIYLRPFQIAEKLSTTRYVVPLTSGSI
jgi:beta-glucosidase